MTIETLRIIWWALLGVLFIAFAVMDGFDLGAATILPFVARNDLERRVVLNTIGPVWEGNQVWIILGAGAVFAAWPYAYAVAFSGPYLAVLLLLLSMGISRPVSFKYRSKLPSDTWRRWWDRVVVFGGLVPAVIFGVLVGNILQGLPFYFDEFLGINYTGSLFDLLNPFALWCGVTSLAMLCMHGGLYLAIKTDNPIRQRAIFCSRVAAFMTIVFFACGGMWIAWKVAGYQVVSGVNPLGPSNPLHKEVVPRIGAWLDNYQRYPVTRLAPMLGLFGATIAFFFAGVRSSHFAFFGSAMAIIGIIATVGLSMFPFILPSSTNLGASLLVWDASSSELTLQLMLGAVIVFLPIILFYTHWVYRLFQGKVRVADVAEDKNHVAY